MKGRLLFVIECPDTIAYTLNIVYTNTNKDERENETIAYGIKLMLRKENREHDP